MKALPENKPNFFLLGAGRSGSTQLYHLLNQHPEVFLTTPKEPTFFCEPFQVIKNPIEYFGLYDSVSEEKVIGEASHSYFSNPSTAKVLIILFPKSKFLLILRNPADRAYSLYDWMRRHGYEEHETFEAALEVEEERFCSKDFRNNPPQYLYNSLYYRSGLYGEQLKRYLEFFPIEQFHIVKFEEFIKNINIQMKNIFNFLEIDENFEPKLEVDRNQGSVSKLTDSTKKELLLRYKPDLETLFEISEIAF